MTCNSTSCTVLKTLHQNWGDCEEIASFIHFSVYVSIDYVDQLDIQQDLISCDVIVFETYEDGQSSERRNKAIRDLFQNAYSALLYIFERASQTTTYLADLKKRMHNVGRIEKLEHAVSLRAIFQSLEVEKQWNDLRLLIVAIACLPLEAKKEKAAARMVFNHYRSHLNAYKRTTSIKDSEALMKAYGKDEEADLVPLEITVDKNIENYTWEECVTMGNRFFGVPARPRSARPGSTILVFMVPKTLARKIEEKLSKPDIRWLMKELGVLQVHPPGICNKEMTAAISPHSIRVGLESGVDFISLTEVNVYCIFVCACVHVFVCMHVSVYICIQIMPCTFCMWGSV